MSTAPRLPTVRLPQVIPGASGESSPQDPVVLDLPPSGKFGFAWPTDAGPAPSLPSLADRHISLSSSDADSPPSDHEPELEDDAEAENVRTRRWSIGAAKKGYGEEDLEESDFTTPTNRLNLEKNPLDQASPPLHRLSRAFSVPLSSQIGHLKNPKRSPLSPPPDFFPPTVQPSPDLVHFHELSLELADSLQMVIQTLLQLSPPQMFDPAKEQYSACALPIPTSSVSALFTVMKSLNYMSANMASLNAPISSRLRESFNQTTINEGSCSPIFNAPLQASQVSMRDFDIGENLQSAGDALSGMAADLGVDLVLFHGDVGMKHIAVKGDEIGISYTLSHIVRQILATAHRGDCIQIGLFLVAPVSASPGAGETPVFEVPLDATEPADSVAPPDPDSPLRCTFQITHNFVHNIAGTPPRTTPVRTKPNLDSHILHRLMHHTNASLTRELTDTAFICKLSMTLERGSPAVVDPAIVLSENDPILQAFPDLKLSEEPTLEDLAQFVGSLKGKKVSLYADATGMFAQHLTSYLTSWGLDVSHASSDEDVEASPAREALIMPSAEHPPVVNEALGSSSILQTLDEQDSPPSAPLTPRAPKQTPYFVMIDDDISVLREHLRKLRVELPNPSQFSRKRPNLAANHRPRSSPQVVRIMGHSSTTSSPRSAPAIIHFTSLANFKLVKGILQSVLGPSNGTAACRLPEVMVIPKPAGPRRVLTALHTAAMKPIVDPFFSPIATSPISPGLYPAASYFQQSLSPKSPMSRPSPSPRGYSYHSMRSPRAAVEPTPDTFGLPPSPLGLTEGMDYFSEAAEKLGSSPSSGLVIQSPNGQPAAIFFHPPRARSSRSGSHGVSGEDGQTSSRGSRRHSDMAERTRSGGGVTFLGLPGSVQQRRNSPITVPVDAGRSGTGAAMTMTAIPGGELPATSGASHAGTSPTTRQGAKRTGAMETSPTSAKPSSSRRGSGNRRAQTEKVTFPSPSPMRKAKPSEPSIVPPISVLIVEDNPINQTLLSTFMRKKKIKYDVAKNGEEAVEKWQSGRFHLILMDIQMPVMDGISATKEIRRLEKLNASQGYPGTPQTEGQRTPSDISNDSRMSSSPFRSSVIIVALTASSLQSDRVAALAAGCNDFLTKPVSLEWLNSKIIEWGSIKALQMFADCRPDFVKSVSVGQTVQAQNIARRLHMPEGRVSPSPSRPLSQPVVSGAVSTAAVSGSSASIPDEPTPMGSSTPSLMYKSFGGSVQEQSNGTPGLHHAPLSGNAKEPVLSGATAYTETTSQSPERCVEGVTSRADEPAIALGPESSER